MLWSGVHVLEDVGLMRYSTRVLGV